MEGNSDKLVIFEPVFFLFLFKEHIVGTSGQDDKEKFSNTLMLTPAVDFSVSTEQDVSRKLSQIKQKELLYEQLVAKRVQERKRLSVKQKIEQAELIYDSDYKSKLIRNQKVNVNISGNMNIFGIAPESRKRESILL